MKWIVKHLLLLWIVLCLIAIAGGARQPRDLYFMAGIALVIFMVKFINKRIRKSKV